MGKYLSDEQLEHMFTYHAPHDEAVKTAHENVRALCRDLAITLNHHLPECPEKTLAIRKLEEMGFYAHAAIARNM